VESIGEAREALRKREGIPGRNGEKDIAAWPGGDPQDPIVAEISRWASNQSVTQVLWTGLPPKFKGEDNRLATEDEAVEYLGSLCDEARRAAEPYIRMTPRQIDTPYRRRFEAEFGWTSVSDV
jgi:hypothetical protein